MEAIGLPDKLKYDSTTKQGKWQGFGLTVFWGEAGISVSVCRKVVNYYSGSPSILGIAEFIVPTGSFFHVQTHAPFHITRAHLRLTPPKNKNQYGYRMASDYEL